MSKDIRSFFVPIKSNKPNLNGKPSAIKRKALSSSSDEDEPKTKSKSSKDNTTVKSTKNLNKKFRIIDSDDDEDKKQTKSPHKQHKNNLQQNKNDLEPFLEDIPKRVERKRPQKTNDDKKIENNLHEQNDKCTSHNDKKSNIETKRHDEISNPSKLELDNNKSPEKKSSPRKHNEQPEESPKKYDKISEKSPRKHDEKPKKTPRKQDEKPEKTPRKQDEKQAKTPRKHDEKQEKTPKKHDEKTSKKHDEKSEGSPPKLKINDKSPEKKISPRKHDEKSSTAQRSKSKTPKKEIKDEEYELEDVPLNKQVLTDEERHERKRLAAVLYQKFKNRQSVINKGCKEVPKGKPNCLAGLSFLVTGILESLERDEAQNIIKELGGKVMSTVGKRLNYLIAGEEAGPKKLATAQELGIKILSEDDLFNLIRERSDQKQIDDTSNTLVTESKSRKEINVKKEEKTSVKSPKKRKLENDNESEISNKVAKKSSPKKTTDDINEIKIPSPVAVLENVENLAWVEKYKPINTKQIIGQQGAASNVVKLRNWLSKWYQNHDGKKKLQKPNPWATNDDGSYYKAALLSGPPGVGKTTTVSLVCKELDFDTVEFNASDTRNRRLLKEEVHEILSNKSLFGYCRGDNEKVSKKHVLIMDEVDGMSGNEDRGGMQELINLIKESSIPIICMCNDRNHPKIRSLVNYCYDLRFNRPRLEQIKGAMMSICYKENLKIPPQKLEEIISSTNHDVRQTINILSMISAGKEINLDNSKAQAAKKDLKLGPWEVVRKVFSAEEHKNMTIFDKSDLFFNDYSLGPLFVQQNYLQVQPKVPKDQVICQIAKTADSLTLGDLIEKRIRSNNAWSLLPVQAMFSSVIPGEYMAGHMTGQINFPAWLGKNSKTTKRSRLAQEIHNHTKITTSSSRLSIRLDYAPFLLNTIIRPLQKYGMDGVEKALQVMKDYHLLREDLDTLVELTTWPGKKNPLDGIEGKVKAALTRAYNKEVLPYSYSAVSNIKKKRLVAGPDDEFLENDDADVVDEDDEDDDNLEHDALIKKKKPSAKASKSEKTEDKSGKKKTATASTSKGRGKK